MDSWLGVEIRHLAALAAIDEERSFRGAADRLGYVQSAVSQQIARLEDMVGTRLVERTRGHRDVGLTREGELLLAHARQVLTQLQAAHSDLRALTSGGSTTLHIGTFQSIATRLMPSIWRRLAVARPNLRIVTAEANTDADLFSRIESGELDAAFGELPMQCGPFEARELGVDPCVLLVARDSPLAELERTPTLAEITAGPLVAHPTWRMAELIDAQIRAEGLQLDYVHQSDDNSTIQAIASAGLAAAIMPRLAVNEDDPSVAAIDLSELLPSRRIAIYWHRARSRQPALEAFCEMARKVWRDVTVTPKRPLGDAAPIVPAALIGGHVERAAA